MITWEKYVGCEVEVTEFDKTITKGFIEKVKNDRFYIYSPEIGFPVPILKKDVVGLKYAKKVEDLTLKEWELWAKNWMEKKLIDISIDPESGKRWFTLRNRDNSKVRVCFGSIEEIDMLKVHGECLE